MSTSLRFRSRQSEKSVESSSALRWQAAIEWLVGQTRDVASRYASHLVVIAVAVFVFYLKPISLDIKTDFPLILAPTPAPALGIRTAQDTVSGRGGLRDPVESEQTIASPQAAPASYVRISNPDVLMTTNLTQAPVVHTIIPKRLRREIITYEVQPGDNVGKIALKFDLEPETVMWANGSLAQNPDLLRPGQELVILPIDGVYHTVIKGDTLSSIAKKYLAEVESIVKCSYNNLDPEDPQIHPADKIIVPGGIKPYEARQVTAYKGPIPADAQKGTGVFAWPTSGRLTDRFGFRTFSGRWHNGLDIANAQGTSIYAADSGFVTFAGWQNNGYGNIIVIDHRNGYVTYYAHLSSYYVSAGQSVAKGTLIAAMGSTGNSTGSHLHFEIRHKGVRKNPEMYLP